MSQNHISAEEEGLSTSELSSPLTMGDLLTALSLVAGPDFPARSWYNVLRNPQSVIATAAGVITQDGNQDASTASAPVSAAAPASATAPAPTAAPALATAPAPTTAPALATAPTPATAIGPAAVTEPGVRWYAITAGLQVGVFNELGLVSSLVVGVPGSCHARYSTRAAAQAAYDSALENGAVRIIV